MTFFIKKAQPKKEELETFGDLETYSFCEEGHGCPVCNTISSGDFYCDCEGKNDKDVRELAIKHIKELEKEKEATQDLDIRIVLIGKISWIMYFFNIKEDAI